MNTQSLLSSLATIYIVLIASLASAQTYQPSTRIPVADNSLGTQVSGANNNFTITGGLNRGQNLFHSFQDFSVPTGGAATFFNPAGNQSIITRVTGRNFSDIDGTINTQGANFFLINPNGMVFGANTQLNVGQTFVGSTANSINLVDAAGNDVNFATDGSDAPLLTINRDALLNVSRLNMGASIPNTKGIVNYGTIEPKNDSQYIGLFGGNITLDGRYGSGRIIASGGRVDLGGLNTAGTIIIDGQGLVFGGNSLTRGDVSLLNGGQVTVRAGRTLETVNPSFNKISSLGSSININANNLEIINDRSTLNPNESKLDAGLAKKYSNNNSSTGDIKINVTGSVNLNFGGIYNTIESSAEGKIGDIKINGNSLSLKNESNIWSRTYGVGSGGNIDIKTTGNINIIGTNDESLLDGNDTQALSRISSNTLGQGNTGKITIDTKGDLSLSNRGGIFSNIKENGEGNSQGINIMAKNLNVETISSIQANNDGLRGNGGNIDIVTTGNLTIKGTDRTSLLQGDERSPLSAISSDSFREGNTGKVTVKAKGDVFITNRGGITSIVKKTEEGNSQGISINAKNLTLKNLSFIESDNFSSNDFISRGNAGDIDIKTTGDLTVTNDILMPKSDPNATKSNIMNSTYGRGNTGKITLKVDGSLSLSNDAGIQSEVRAGAVGKSQGISITAGSLSLNNNSPFTMYGGYILSDTFAATDLKKAGEGNAGNIDIITNGNLSIIGTENRSLLTGEDRGALSKISSSSNGNGDAGKITIDTNGNNLFIANRGSISSTVEKTEQGNSQGIEIKTGNLTLKNLSFIESDNFSPKNFVGLGNAGDIYIKATGNLTITNDISIPKADLDLTQANIMNSTYGRGNTGKTTIQVDGNLSLSNRSGIQSEIRAGAMGNGQGINITAGKLSLTNDSQITTDVFAAKNEVKAGEGNAGNIDIKTTQGFIDIMSKSRISSSSMGKGEAANITITTNRLILNNSNIFAKANEVNGGNITFGINNQIMMRNNASITTSSGSNLINSNGGNITINAQNGFIVTAPNENNDIMANAFSGSGGKVDIKTKQNFWISPVSRVELEGRLRTTEANRLNPLNLQTNDITAISQVNPNLSEQMNITPPEIDITAGLSPLPNSVTDPTNQINPNCSAKAIGNNSFTNVGRGGIPATPKAPLNEPDLATNWVRLDPQDTRPVTPLAATPAPTTQPYGSAGGKPIVEAQAWRRERNGDIVLVATANGNLPRQPQPQAGCVER
jgi:filamentous hemagglutinin family protein